jgi:adenosylcobinamide-phosphate synthase
MPLPFHATLLVFTLLAEAIAGYPTALFRAIGHPVSWYGVWISFAEARLNRADWSFARRRLAGVALLVTLVGLAAGAGLLPRWLAPSGWMGLALEAVFASSLLAQRSLYTHVRAVAVALETGGLPAGRQAVAMIVGRNVETLDEAGVARAAIESLAENFSDGVVAPAFWIGIAGLPGGAVYKAVNTADSMIGHRNARYEAFGWAAARFDDLINLPASRLSALWLALAALVTPGANARCAWRGVWRDASRHRSPNAGWPEAAMAGALGLQLAGPRVYGDALVDDAFMGDGRRDAGSADIFRALRLYVTACALQLAAVAMLALALNWRG